ncbi:MAG TPA: hypothetical protein VK966_10965 [Longimicrobiales bacterium]|nr:hypothetical protein [Longimicrobiales bacterium]
MHWVRVVYLYLFALVGLILLTIGGVQLTSLALRSYVLTEADAEMRVQYLPEPPVRFTAENARGLARDTTLDAEERDALRQWAADYERQREEREAINPVKSRRQRDAARALALLIVGLPLFGPNRDRIIFTR